MGSRGPAWLCCLRIAKVCKSRGGVPGAFPLTHTLQRSTSNSLGNLVIWDHFKIGVGSRQPNKRARKMYGLWQIRAHP